MTARPRTAAKGFAAAACLFIGGWEGLSHVAYRDVVGVLTICYGETRGVKAGERRTKEECDAGLMREIRIHEAGMLKCAPQLAALPDGPYLAHISAGYNIGVGAWCRSSMARYVRAGNVSKSCDALLAWNKGRIGGVLVPISGLTNRRTDERRVCRGGSPS